MYKDRLLIGNEILRQCMVAQVGDDKWYRFTRPEAQHFPKDKISVIHKKWETYDDTFKTKQQAIEKHKAVFGKEPAKNLEKFEITQLLWFEMANKSEDRTNVIAETNNDGSKKRKSSLSTRVYKMHAEADQATIDEIKTPQAKACLQIMKDNLDDKGEVTEAVLKEQVYKRATELKTRQDAWRIFQYYRPQLINRKIIQTT